MVDEYNGVLIRLGDSGQTVADRTDDVRGRPVLNESGAPLGTVEDLLYDIGLRQIRFLRVVQGGVLGWGVTPCYVPVTSVIYAGAAVVVRTSAARETTGPGYVPALAPETDDAGVDLAQPAYAPYWFPGYIPTTYRRWRGNG